MPHRARKLPILACLLPAALIVAAPAGAGANEEVLHDLGKQVFTTEAQPQCGLCHTLADAGTSGAIGPKLDELKPTEQQVRAAVSSGIGVMPAYETLTQEQIDAVAHYVSTVAGQQ